MLSPEKIDEVRAQAFMCKPTLLGTTCLIHPIPVGEIVKMGITEYNRRLGILLLTKDDLIKMITEKTSEEFDTEQLDVLPYLLQSANYNDVFLLELQTAFSTFLKEEVLLLPTIGAIVVGNPEEKRLITQENFEDFQNILRIQNRRETKEEAPKNESYGERKMRLLRERVEEAKRKQRQKEGSEQSFTDLLEIATVFNIDVENVSLFAMYRLIQRH